MPFCAVRGQNVRRHCDRAGTSQAERWRLGEHLPVTVLAIHTEHDDRGPIALQHVGARYRICEVVPAEVRLIPDDGELRVVARWDALRTRFRAAIWPGGVIALLILAVGLARLWVRASRHDAPLDYFRESLVWVGAGLALVGVIALVRRPGNGQPRLLRIHVPVGLVPGFHPRNQIGNAPNAWVVALPDGKGLGLLGDNSVSLRDANVGLIVWTTRGGRVARAAFARGDLEISVRAVGRIPLRTTTANETRFVADLDLGRTDAERPGDTDQNPTR